MADHEDYETGAAPAAHKVSHQDAGTDEISIEGLSGEPAELATHAGLPTVHQDAPALIETHRLVTDAHHPGYTVGDALKIKGVIIDDEGIGDQKVLAYDLATERIVYITPAAPGAAINSIQRFYETMNFETSKDVTITEVNIDNTMLFHNGILPSGTSHDDFLITIKLLDSTTVRLEVWDDTATPSVSFTVVEFSSGIKNIQRGYTHLPIGGPATVDVPITEVDLDKTIASLLGYKSQKSTIGITEVVLRLLNATTLRLQKEEYESYLSWEVVEFSY